MSFLIFIKKQNKFHSPLHFPNSFLFLFPFHTATLLGGKKSIKWVNLKIYLTVINYNQKMKTHSTPPPQNLD